MDAEKSLEIPVDVQLLENKSKSKPDVVRNDRGDVAEASSRRAGCLVKLFTANMSILLLVYMTVLVYSSGVIRTLERRFQMSSKQSATISMMNDLLHIFIVTFIGYFGGKAHKPRVIACTLVIYSSSCFLMASPYWLFPEVEKSPGPDTATVNDVKTSFTNIPFTGNDSSMGFTASRLIIADREEEEVGLCRVNYHDDVDRCGDDVSENRDNLRGAYVIFLVSQFIGGIGGSALSTLGITYIDENSTKDRSSMYIAIATSMYAFGPLTGLTMAAFSLRLPENPFETPVGEPGDPSWIGCWWLGYLVCGVALLLGTVPLWFFPKHIIHQKNRPVRCNSKDDSKVTRTKRSGLKDNLGGFTKAMLSLWKNPAYLFYVLTTVCGCYTVQGFFINIPRYVEIHFFQPAFVGSIIAALVGALAGAFGGLTGGYLMSRFKIRPVGASKLVIFSGLTLLLGVAVAMSLGCPQLNLAGQQQEGSNSISVETPCNTNCSCETYTKSYQPVCGSDGVTYFSACHAGCTQVYNGTFGGCGCVGDPGIGAEDTARAGICRPQCDLIIVYSVMLFVVGLLSSIGRVPGTILQLRIVGDENRSLALGFTSFCMNAFGFIPAPMLLGTLIDSTCRLWQRACGRVGQCLVFDTARFRLLTHAVPLASETLSAVFAVAIYLCIRNKDFSTPNEDSSSPEDQTNKERILIDTDDEGTRND